MAGLKGAIHQITFVMVDATDFATVESGVAAASCTAKFYGVNHKDSVFTSGAVSKAVTVVRSGVMGLILKSTENTFDRMFVKITESDTGCADQHVVWENDAVSVSQINSVATVAADQAGLNSGTLEALVLSDLSDLLGLGVGNSNILSQILVDTATLAGMSDILSQVLVDTVGISDITSKILADTATLAGMSDAISDILIDTATLAGMSNILSQVLVDTVGISDIASEVWAADASSISSAGSIGSLVVKTLDDMVPGMSDTLSQVLADTTGISDITSKILADTATLAGMSDAISDILIDTATLAGMSNILSQVLVDTVGISDITSKVLADTATLAGMSDTLSQVLIDTAQIGAAGAGLTAVPTMASDISDIASRVWSEKWRVHSLASSFGSLFSVIGTGVDVAESRALRTMSDTSDIKSAIADGTALVDAIKISGDTVAAQNLEAMFDGNGYASGTGPASRSQVSVLLSNVSDIQSALDSDIIVRQSQFSDIQSNIDAVTATVSASDISDIASAVMAAMGTDTVTELAAIPSATPTRDEMLKYLYQYFRNKRTQTASRLVMFKDDTATELASAVISDDATTFTKGEFGTP